MLNAFYAIEKADWSTPEYSHNWCGLYNAWHLFIFSSAKDYQSVFVSLSLFLFSVCFPIIDCQEAIKVQFIFLGYTFIYFFLMYLVFVIQTICVTKKITWIHNDFQSLCICDWHYKWNIKILTIIYNVCTTFNLFGREQ